jgi:hypothetical protein
MHTIDMLNIVADLMSDALAWPQPFVIESQTCREINAHWVLSTRRLTVCYELAQDFGTLYREFELASAKAPAKQQGETRNHRGWARALSKGRGRMRQSVFRCPGLFPVVAYDRENLEPRPVSSS